MTAAHAMQTGVKWEMETGSLDTTPKHLRTGVNSALVDCTAIARLLISKGIFTEDEYYTAVADEMEREVQRYRDRNPGVDFA
jgi:hypothetical protein